MFDDIFETFEGWFDSISETIDDWFEPEAEPSIPDPDLLPTPEDELPYELPWLPESGVEPEPISELPNGFGTPVEDATYWRQQEGANSCAVVSQAAIYEAITGYPLSEADACKIAQENGWFDPELGTTPSNVGQLLEALGIDTQQTYDATLLDLANALENGDKVIVGLDANEIWYPQKHWFSGEPLEQPYSGHAVWVTGITTEPDGTVNVFLNDSGTPEGRMTRIDGADFLNAWDDSGNFMVVADTPEAYLISA